MTLSTAAETQTAPCPCGSSKSYAQCCEPYLSHKLHAPTAEALMRSRYTAHVKANVPYIKETLAPESRGGFDEKEVRDWATASEWLGLNVISAKDGVIEFTATYKAHGKVVEHHEVATFRFDREQKRWYFVDGDAHVHEEGQGHHRHEPIAPIVRESPKIGRNDPCACGSGKKYKKCCAVA